MDSKALYLGIDIGSTTFKAVLLSGDGKVLRTVYKRTQPVEAGKVACTGHCSACGNCSGGSVKKLALEFLKVAGVESFSKLSAIVVTGSQIVEDTKKFLPFDFQVSEVTAHVAGAKFLHPDVDAIIDCGGQDSKCMVYNPVMKLWTSMMSGVCAAGTGSFLDSVAQKLGVKVEDVAEKVNYDSDTEFSSVCAVLSATSINKFKNRVPIGDLLAGACKAQARTILNSVGQLLLNAPGRKILFQGGVAFNRAVAYFLNKLTGSEIIIPEHHEVMGALGAACLAVGTWISALTENQILAYLATFGALLVAYLMNGIQTMFTTGNLLAFVVFMVIVLVAAILVGVSCKRLTAGLTVFCIGAAAVFILFLARPAWLLTAFNAVLDALALFEPFKDIVGGMFSIPAIVYYLSVIGLFLFMTGQALERRRWN